MQEKTEGVKIRPLRMEENYCPEKKGGRRMLIYETLT